MDKEKFDLKPIWILLCFILTIVVVCLSINLYQSTKKLEKLEKLFLSSLKGTYYTGEICGLAYTMVFSEEQFLLQYNGETIDVGNYEQYDDTLYLWNTETNSGFVALQYGGIVVYCRENNQLGIMKKYSDVLHIIGPGDPLFDIA